MLRYKPAKLLRLTHSIAQTGFMPKPLIHSRFRITRATLTDEFIDAGILEPIAFDRRDDPPRQASHAGPSSEASSEAHADIPTPFDRVTTHQDPEAFPRGEAVKARLASDDRRVPTTHDPETTPPEITYRRRIFDWFRRPSPRDEITTYATYRLTRKAGIYYERTDGLPIRTAYANRTFAHSPDHDVVLLSLFLHAPRPIKSLWYNSPSLQFLWEHQPGFEPRGGQPPTPDAAFQEVNRWIALEIVGPRSRQTGRLKHQIQSYLLPRHADLNDGYPGWFDEVRVVRARTGRVDRYTRAEDGTADLEHPIVITPDQPTDRLRFLHRWERVVKRLPNGCRPFFADAVMLRSPDRWRVWPKPSGLYPHV